jgi:hypothetical protein
VDIHWQEIAKETDFDIMLVWVIYSELEDNFDLSS